MRFSERNWKAREKDSVTPQGGRAIYVPGWLRVVPWAELSFGWVIDRVGPLLLKKQKTGSGL